MTQHQQQHEASAHGSLSFQSVQAFQGDAAAHQLTFGVGEILWIHQDETTNLEQQINDHQGWAYGFLPRTETSGWFPFSFVEPMDGRSCSDSGGTTTASPVHHNPSTETEPQSEDTDDARTDQHETTTTTSSSRPIMSSLPSWKEAGSSIRKARRQARSTIVKSATVVGEGLTKAASHTGAFFETGWKQSPSLNGGAKASSTRSSFKIRSTVKSGLFGQNQQTTTFGRTYRHRMDKEANLDKTTTQETRTTEQSSWLGGGGVPPFATNSVSSTTTTTTSSPHQANPLNDNNNNNPNARRYRGGPRTPSAAEEVTGGVATLAAVSGALCLIKGNVKGAIGAGAISATAFALQGHAAEHARQRHGQHHQS